MSRFSVTPLPSMSPACCKICGTATRGPFIDMHHAEEFYGSIYYCFDCASELAALVGFVHPDKYQALIEENARLEHDIAEAEFALTKAKNLSGLLDDLVKRYDDAVLGAIISSSNTVTEIPPVTNETVDSGASVSNEPSNESGLADVLPSGNINEAKRAGSRAKLVDI